MMRWIGRLAITLLAIGTVVPVGLEGQSSAGTPSKDRTLSPYFEVEGDASGRLPLHGTDVDVHISGVIASVVVRQTYENTSDRPIDARYVFPASTRAAVGGMRMRLGARVVEAVIREKKQARREFEQARSEGKAAALLEEHRPNVFEMGLANILPGERIEVELRYTELLVATDGEYEFVYPTVIGPRYTGGGTEGVGDASRLDGAPPRSPDHPDDSEGAPWSWSTALAGPSPEAAGRFDIEMSVAAGMPVRELEVPSHRTVSTWGDDGSVEVELDRSEATPGDRDFVARYRLADEDVAAGIMLQEGGDERFFTLLIEPPRRVVSGHVPPREYVFVLDVSGSMSGFPLLTGMRLVRDLVAGLGPGDSFNVLLFAGGSELMSERSVPASIPNIHRAIRFIEEGRKGGGTELGRALRVAMGLPRDRPVARSVVLVTDGFISAEDDVFRLIRGSLDHTSVFAFGIGSSPNRHLVEGVARAGLGEPFVVADPDEAAEAAERFRSYVTSPVLTQVKLSFDGFEAYDLEPAVIPDVFADRPVVVKGKWRGARAGRVTIEGHTGSGPYRQHFAIADLPTRRHDGLAHLWARTRVTTLSDAALSGPADGVRDEIVSIGLRYGLLTPYTSFVAVDRIVRTDRAGRDADSGPQPRSAHEQELTATRSLRVGSEPGLALLLIVCAALLTLARRRRPATPVGTAPCSPRTGR